MSGNWQDPNLIPAGNSGQMGVPALEARTKPLGTTRTQEMRYYANSHPNASMFRTDGKRLFFQYGVYGTDILQDQDFLDKEIADGHPYLTHATPDQVHQHRMTVAPKETIRAEVTMEIESDLRAKILAEIAAGTTVVPGLDADKLAGVDIADKLRAIQSGGARITPVSSADLTAIAQQ
jgi:hypothetical protein